MSGFWHFLKLCNAKSLLWETQLLEISSFSTTFPFALCFLLVLRGANYLQMKQNLRITSRECDVCDQGQDLFVDTGSFIALIPRSSRFQSHGSASPLLHDSSFHTQFPPRIKASLECSVDSDVIKLSQHRVGISLYYCYNNLCCESGFRLDLGRFKSPLTSHYTVKLFWVCHDLMDGSILPFY